MDYMNIVLVSDIHYGKCATSEEFSIEGENMVLGEIQNAKPLLQGMIDVLKAENPDYLFVAGDLTSTGSPLEFKYCYQKIFELGKQIGIPPQNIVFCLGNHDVDWRITKAIDVFSKEYCVDDHAFLKEFYQDMAYDVSRKVSLTENIHPFYKVTYDKPFTGVLEYSDCVVYVLNSGYMSAHNQEYKHGYLSIEQLRWFEKEAQKYRSSNKIKIVLLHHHPFNYAAPLPSLDISTLEEGSEFSDICGRNGIDLVLHGHRHQPQAKTRFETGWIKPVTFICAGSLSVNATDRYQIIPNTFHLISCQKSEEVVLRNYSYSPIDGWIPSSYTTGTPVDSIMWLGKIVSLEKAEAIIKKLPLNQKISYLSLEPELKYFPIKILMELIHKVHKEREIFGEFPNEVMIFNCKEA